MSELSPNLGLSYVQAAQAQKHVTVNETFRRLDALTHLAVASRGLATPPAVPGDGERYLVPAGATDAWAGQDGRIAAYQDGAWVFFSAKTGWRLYVADENIALLYSGAAWAGEPAGGFVASDPAGAATKFAILSEDHTLSLAGTSDSAILIPNRAVVFGVTALVLSEVTGAASWDLGVAGAEDRYGNTIATSAGGTLNGVSGQPVAYYADTALRLTANGGAFTGGVVRLAIHYLSLTGPSA